MRLKVLMSAYACEPGVGSEQEVGWRWAIEMSKECDVTVITRSNSKHLIDSWISNHPQSTYPRFIYTDLPGFAMWLKKHIPGGLYAYYSLWQIHLRKVAHKLIQQNDYDLGHHVTFASFRFNVGLSGLPLVWGPIGGGDIAPTELINTYGTISGRLRERFRNLMTCLSKGWLLLSKPSARDLHTTIATTPATHDILKRSGIDAAIMPTIGCEPSKLVRETGMKPENKIRLLYVGRLHLLKGIHLLLEAIAGLPQERVSLDIVGDGPEEYRLKSLSKSLGVDEFVTFHGKLPREELCIVYTSHDIMVSPSLYESGGLGVLEAFSHGLPAIVLDCGGHAISVAEDCGTRIPCNLSKQETVLRIRMAIEKYISNPELIDLHGYNARNRLTNIYDWNNKRKAMLQIYKDSAGAPSKA